MDALAIGRVEERRCRWSGPGEGAVVADIDPQAADPGPLLGQHRDRGVVAVQPLGREDVRPDQPRPAASERRPQRPPNRPGSRRRSRRLRGRRWHSAGSAAGAARTSPPAPGPAGGAGSATGDRMRGGRRLADRFAGAAGDLLPHVLDHLPAPRLALEGLGHVLAQLADRAAALGAGARRRVDDALAGQVLRQRAAGRLAGVA